MGLPADNLRVVVGLGLWRYALLRNGSCLTVSYGWSGVCERVMVGSHDHGLVFRPGLCVHPPLELREIMMRRASAC